MSTKTLVILFGIFIVLALAASYSWWSGYISFLNPSPRNLEIDFSQFTKETTEKISIAKKNEQEKMIIKENGSWKIAAFDASEKAIDDFFETLNGLKVGSLVSKNQENYSNFGVGDDAYMLSLTKNGQTVTFVIGNRGPSFNSFYARKKDGVNVYLVAGSITDKLSQNISAWRDKTMINLSKEAIQKIEIVSKADPLTIIKNQDGKWLAEGGGKKTILEETMANRLFAALSPLEASDFLNKEQEAEFKKAADKAVLCIFDAGNKKLVEIQLLKKDTDWWAEVEGKDIYYQVAAYKLSDIILQHKEIFKEKNN